MKSIILNILGIITILLTLYYLALVWIFNNLTLRKGQESVGSDTVLSSAIIILNFLFLLFLIYSLVVSIWKIAKKR
jgi:hypothetical protein